MSTPPPRDRAGSVAVRAWILPVLTMVAAFSGFIMAALLPSQEDR